MDRATLVELKCCIGAWASLILAILTRDNWFISICFFLVYVSFMYMENKIENRDKPASSGFWSKVWRR